MVETGDARCACRRAGRLTKRRLTKLAGPPTNTRFAPAQPRAPPGFDIRGDGHVDPAVADRRSGWDSPANNSGSRARSLDRNPRGLQQLLERLCARLFGRAQSLAARRARELERAAAGASRSIGPAASSTQFEHRPLGQESVDGRRASAMISQRIRCALRVHCEVRGGRRYEPCARRPSGLRAARPRALRAAGRTSP